MDRRQIQPDRIGPPETFARDLFLPSRQQALELLDLAVGRADGPVLLTGEPGSGKTWLVSQWLARSNKPAWRWVAVDVPPGTGSADLLGTIASGLGLVVREGQSASGSRRALVRFLSEQAEDGRGWGLVVDEAHLASLEALEEVRVFSNRIGQAGGFQAVVLVGQTELARRMTTWPLRALEARLSGRIHLGPVDADEALLLLGPAVDRDEAERRHRDSAGNPGRLLRIDPPGRRPVPRSSARRARLVSEETRTEAGPNPPIREKPAQASLLPARPPLRVEDGVIEVGWDAGPDEDTAPDEAPGAEVPTLSAASSSGPDDTSTARSSRPSAPLGEDVPVADHYAALQAWNEWKANQDRSAERPGAEIQVDPADDSNGEEDDLYPPPPRRPDTGDEEFAPYKQLLSRLSETQPEG